MTLGGFRRRRLLRRLDNGLRRGGRRRGNRRRGHRHGIRRRWRLRQIDDRFRMVRRGRDCSGSRQAWDGQCRADDHDDASQHEPRPPCQSPGGRRWTRRRSFRWRCHVFGSRRCLFHGEFLSAGRGSRRLHGSGTTSATPRGADKHGCFRALVAPGRPDGRNSHAASLFTGVRVIAGQTVTERSLDFQQTMDNPIRPMNVTVPAGQSTISTT